MGVVASEHPPIVIALAAEFAIGAAQLEKQLINGSVCLRRTATEDEGKLFAERIRQTGAQAYIHDEELGPLDSQEIILEEDEADPEGLGYWDDSGTSPLLGIPKDRSNPEVDVSGQDDGPLSPYDSLDDIDTSSALVALDGSDFQKLEEIAAEKAKKKSTEPELPPPKEPTKETWVAVDMPEEPNLELDYEAVRKVDSHPEISIADIPTVDPGTAQTMRVRALTRTQDIQQIANDSGRIQPSGALRKPLSPGLFNGWFRKNPNMRVIVGLLLALVVGALYPISRASSVMKSEIEPLRQKLSTAKVYAKEIAHQPGYRSAAQLTEQIGDVKMEQGLLTFFLWLGSTFFLAALWFRFT
jgi:hypothetical protein